MNQVTTAGYFNGNIDNDRGNAAALTDILILAGYDYHNYWIPMLEQLSD